MNDNVYYNNSIKTTQATPSLHLFLPHVDVLSILRGTCILFGTAIPTSLYTLLALALYVCSPTSHKHKC